VSHVFKHLQSTEDRGDSADTRGAMYSGATEFECELGYG
jgi:hypothetical protein